MSEEQPAQRALAHGPGRFRSLLTFRLKPGVGAARAVRAVAELLAHSEQLLAPAGAKRPKPLKILTALSLQTLAAGADERTGARASAEKLRSEGKSLSRLEHTQDHVLVQIGAETEDERTYALRLVYRLFSAALDLQRETHGGRHTLSLEAFGYRDGTAYNPEPAAPAGAAGLPQEREARRARRGPATTQAASGACWLLYLDCEQHTSKFFKENPAAQDAIMGQSRARPNGTEATRAPADASHIAAMTEFKDQIVRRSFSYEGYGKAGLAFVATASTAEPLRAAANAFFERDRLGKYSTVHRAGFYVVPPSSDWLVRAPLEVAALEAMPAAERLFFPENPLVLYEMTPATRDFFLKVFHENKDNFDEGGTLRPDLQLLGKGMAKCLYGGEIRKDSLLYALLELAFTPDTTKSFGEKDTVAISQETSDAAATLAGKRKAHREAQNDSWRKERAKRTPLDEIRQILVDADQRYEAEVTPDQAKIRSSIESLGAALCGATLPPGTTVSAIFDQVLASDLTTMRGELPARKDELRNIIELCKEAADEARELNMAVGRYMTFIC